MGVGSCNYKNGKTMLNTTENGGTYYDEYGDLIRMWTWDKKPLQVTSRATCENQYEKDVERATTYRVNLVLKTRARGY